MGRRSCFLLPFICCLVLFLAGCSWTKAAKADKDAKLAAEESKNIGAADAVDKDAEGGKWERYGSDRYGVGYYYEKKSVSYPSKGFVHVRRKRVFPDRAPQKQLVEIDEIDCKETTYRSLELVTVFKDDSSKTFNKISPWTYVFPGSADETLMLNVCLPAGSGK